MKREILLLLFLIGTINLILSQNLLEGQKRWSQKERLTIEDFKIKISDNNNEPIYSQFVISHKISGIDFIKRNLNQKIENIFLGNASWIDTTRISTIQSQIDFQQLQFDLAEIYVRKFRKRALENRKKIVSGFEIINQINDKVLSEFSERRVILIKETEGGNNEENLKEWKDKIAAELKNLYEFRYENKKKIKINK